MRKILLCAIVSSLILSGCSSASKPQSLQTKQVETVIPKTMKAKQEIRVTTLSLLPKDYKEKTFKASNEPLTLKNMEISYVYPIRVKPGMLVSIRGSGFGAIPTPIFVGSSEVKDFLQWTDDTIWLRIPSSVKDGDQIKIDNTTYGIPFTLAPKDSIRIVVQIDAKKAQETIDSVYKNYDADTSPAFEAPYFIKGQWSKGSENFGDYSSAWDGGNKVLMFNEPGTSIWTSEIYFTEENFAMFKKKIVYFAIEDSNQEKKNLSMFESDAAAIIKKEWGTTDDIDDSDTDPGFKVSKKSKNYIENEDSIYAIFPTPGYTIKNTKDDTLPVKTLSYDLAEIKSEVAVDVVKLSWKAPDIKTDDKINIYIKTKGKKVELVNTLPFNTTEAEVKLPPFVEYNIIVKIINKEGTESPGKTIEKQVTRMKNVILDKYEGRDMQIYLPEGYESGNDRYPVVYMHDGQNLFNTSTCFKDEWQVDENADALIKNGKIEKVIVVGIYNSSKRGDEYTPYKYTNLEGGKAGEFSEFVVKKIIPYIDGKYKTIPNRENRAVMGSSFGGILSLWMGLKYPDVFSSVGALSPSLWVSNGEIFRDIAKFQRKDLKIWIDTGSAEWLNLDRLAVEAFIKKGYVYGKDVFYYEDKDAEHLETAWAKRIDDALIMFKGKEAKKLEKITLDTEVVNDDFIGRSYFIANPMGTFDNGITYSLLNKAVYSISGNGKFSEFDSVNLNGEEGKLPIYGLFNTNGEKEVEIGVKAEGIEEKVKLDVSVLEKKARKFQRNNETVKNEKAILEELKKLNVE